MVLDFKEMRLDFLTGYCGHHSCRARYSTDVCKDFSAPNAALPIEMNYYSCTIILLLFISFTLHSVVWVLLLNLSSCNDSCFLVLKYLTLNVVKYLFKCLFRAFG